MYSHETHKLNCMKGRKTYNIQTSSGRATHTGNAKQEPQHKIKSFHKHGGSLERKLTNEEEQRYRTENRDALNDDDHDWEKKTKTYDKTADTGRARVASSPSCEEEKEEVAHTVTKQEKRGKQIQAQENTYSTDTIFTQHSRESSFCCLLSSLSSSNMRVVLYLSASVCVSGCDSTISGCCCKTCNASCIFSFRAGSDSNK